MPKVGKRSTSRIPYVFIHTLGRPNKQTTYEQLPFAVRNKTTLVVQHHERDLYGDYDDVNVMVLPKHIKTLSPTRQWLLERCAKIGIKRMVMMDDDLTFSARRSHGVKLFAAEPDEVTRMFRTLNSLLDSHLHAGVSAREGNNHVEDSIKTIGRMMRCLAYKPKEVLELGCRFDRVITKQDFDMTLQLLRKGKPNAILYNYAQNQRGSNTEGGCSTYRTTEVMDEGAEALRKLHPEYVTVVEKTTKKSWGGGVRKDVRISWQKAFASSGK